MLPVRSSLELNRSSSDTLIQSKGISFAHAVLAIAKMEPIAVIGFDLKFPGDACDTEGFFKLLKDGRSALVEVPATRYNLNSFYHYDKDRLGTFSSLRIFEFIDSNVMLSIGQC